MRRPRKKGRVGGSTWLVGVVLLLAQTLAWAQGPKRIVSTSPVITETLFALGMGEKVVAVSDYCHYPQQARRLPHIGSYLQPNVEAIVRLRPDLVFMEQLPNQAIAQLQRFGVRVVKVATGDVATNLKMMETIAGAAGAKPQGEALVARVRRGLAEVAEQSKGKSRQKVLFLVGRTPGRLEGMVAVGKGSYLNELLSLAGAENLLAGSALPYPKITLEAVLRLKPDVIVDIGEMTETEGVTEAQKQKVVALWAAQRNVKARVVAIADDIFVVPGPRMVEAAQEMVRFLHPNK